MENAVVAASTLDRLVRRCDWASSRKQVYELLTDLMLDSPANYREGIKSLQRLHLQVRSNRGPGLRPAACWLLVTEPCDSTRHGAL